MNKNIAKFLRISVLAGVLSAVSVHAELVRNPSQVSAYVDVGQIVSGVIYDGAVAPPPGSDFRTENQTITRTGVYLTESGVYHDRLTVRMTIGGLFWFALPESEDFQTRRIQFGPGVGQVQGIYAFGADPRNPAATLQFGLFPHKYSESVNLGEYLYRSGTYPSMLTSGGWSYINAASFSAQGIRLSVPMLNGTLKHDVTVYMERGLAPAHDLSPGYMVTYKPVPFLELGAGVVWSHAVSFDSDRLAPEAQANAYDKTTERPASGDTAAVNECRDNQTNCGYYTFKGFKTMARASVDIGSLLGVGMIGPGDFKLYTEAALLGVEDQPYFYENKMERTPVMVGANLPTFGLLDRLAVEGEYLASPFPNSNVEVLQNRYPIPVGDPYSYDIDDPQFDEWKWTVYARRRVVDGVTVYAQAASDHQRHFNYSAIPGAETATPESSDWYYVLRLEFGI